MELIKPTKCPQCGVEVCGADDFEGSRPEPGCFAICGVCRGINMFDDDMNLVIPDGAERERIITQSPKVDELRAAIAKVRKPGLN